MINVTRRAKSPEVPRFAAAASPSLMLDTAIRIGLLAVLVYACARIVSPFVGILAWSAILAVMLDPLHRRLAIRVGTPLSATLIGIVGIALALGPIVIVMTAVATSLYGLVSTLQGQELSVPGPPLWLDGTPLVGKKLTEIWMLVATNLPAALSKYGQFLKAPTVWVASLAGRLVAGELAFVLSFAIAAVLVANGDRSTEVARRVLVRVTGNNVRAAQLVGLTAATIRGVALGVVGVALIQSLLLGVGFLVVGLSTAGLLTFVAFLAGIAQVPLILLTLPVVCYVFVTAPTEWAIGFLIWNLIVGLSDNVLKPLLLATGLEVPMPVILVGVLGGMLVDGLLGLFVGPALLAVSYMLLNEWSRQNPVDGGSEVSRPES